MLNSAIAYSTLAHLEPDWTAFSIDFWGKMGIDIREYREWCQAYVRKFHQCPREFWHWYRQQQRDLLWEAPHPHEVFPQLIENDYGFYSFIEEVMPDSN